MFISVTVVAGHALAGRAPHPGGPEGGRLAARGSRRHAGAAHRSPLHAPRLAHSTYHLGCTRSAVYTTSACINNHVLTRPNQSRTLFCTLSTLACSSGCRVIIMTLSTSTQQYQAVALPLQASRVYLHASALCVPNLAVTLPV